MRIAVLADTHGNLLALEAVLTDSAHPSCTRSGRETWATCSPAPSTRLAAPTRRSALRCPTLTGQPTNATCWRATTPVPPWPSRGPVCRQPTWTGSRPCLRRSGSWMARCSLAMAAQQAATSTTYWRTWRAGDRCLRPRVRSGRGWRASALHAWFCAATRTCPRVVQVGDVLVVNPGSIGMPAYTDDNPVPHAIETGTPHARYAVGHAPSRRDSGRPSCTLSPTIGARPPNKHGRTAGRPSLTRRQQGGHRSGIGC